MSNKVTVKESLQDKRVNFTGYFYSLYILGGDEIGRRTAAKAVDWPWKSAMG